MKLFNQLKQSKKFLDFRDTNSINYQHILEPMFKQCLQDLNVHCDRNT